jgi:hypothetical protein
MDTHGEDVAASGQPLMAATGQILLSAHTRPSQLVPIPHAT